ncbi:hypothetical protein GCK72_019183 [Caenorhabditis remanei]|uniref:G-protein coupled receptors family 1 profile domain-containing protein n=1 Tax=Caenorhabditis remanei TaxID=31234 RepID=A0A6A5GBY9_CAERE|nr:hypothetical protein GCK72_019183 [Caenorhabditis remanei]KAF1752628.1 hypothetical protein GCK72_019183 [Caenorhabditis remanei]
MENDTSNSQNFRKFTSIENSNRSLQQPLMDCINIFSIIWLSLFAITVLTKFLILIVRLRGVARQESYFRFSTATYCIFTALLSFYILVPMPFCWISSGSSVLETQTFVKNNYPNAMKVLDIPGVFIYTDSWKFRRILIVTTVLMATGGCLYLILCQVILHEIHQQCKIWSEKVLKYHRKALKDTVIQTIILTVFIAAAPVFHILNAFRDPETDTITLTIISNAIFVSSPIPYAMTILYQNTAYRRFIVSMFRFRNKQKTPRIGATIQVSIVNIKNSPRTSNSGN